MLDLIDHDQGRCFWIICNTHTSTAPLPWKPEPFLGGSPEKMFFQPFDVEFILQVAFGGDQYRIVIL